jgi:hypothetical protein
MRTPPRVLLSWEINPGYTPPMRFSSQQVTACRSVPVLMPFFSSKYYDVDIWTPPGSYDLYEEVRRQIGDTRFDLVIVWSSSAYSYRGLYNVPRNTKAFGCPTMLIAGDTHHMFRPITTMIGYLQQEQFDFVTSFYDRQHLHWFGAAGASHVGWFPVASVVDVPAATGHEKLNSVCFFGHTHEHPLRARILEDLQQLQIPLAIGARARESAASEYARNLISLNCSLNGDLNLRTHEVLAAGGFLLTDKLSDYSGFHYLFKSGTDCDTYASLAEFMEKLRFYRKYPELALRIARAGYEQFHRELHPSIRIKQIADWVVDGVLPSYTDPTTETRYGISKMHARHLLKRIEVYETIQDIHRTNEAVTVLIASGSHPIHVVDLVDLVRLRIFGIADDLFLRESARAWGISDTITWLAPDVAARKNWDCVIAGPEGKEWATARHRIPGLLRSSADVLD